MNFYKTLILKEFSGQIIEFILRTILGLIIIKKLSYYLGPESYGSLLFIESNYLLILGLSLFGFEPVFIKLFTENNKIKTYLINGIYLSFTISVIFFLLFYFFNYYILNFQYRDYLFYVSCLILLNTSFFAEYYFHSKNKIRYISFLKLVAYLIGFILKLIAIKKELELFHFIQIIILENLIIHLVYFSFLFKKYYRKINFEFPQITIIKEIFSSTFYIFLYGLGLNLFSRIDILMIEKYLNLDDLGNYTASFKIVSFTYIIPTIIATTFYPKILEVKDNNERLIEKMYFFSFWSSVTIFISLFLVSDLLIDFFYSEDFLTVNKIFKISIIPISIAGISATYIKRLYSIQKQKNIFIRSIFGICINVLLNLKLIPIYGVIGVSISTVISILLMELVYDFFDPSLKNEHKFKLKSILNFNNIIS